MDASPAVNTVPLPPRPYSAAIRRRAWTEPTVRFWWMLGLTLLLMAPLVGAGPVRRWHKLSTLSEQPPTSVKIVRTDRDTVNGRPVLPGSPVQIQIVASPGTLLWGSLDGWANGPLPRIGDVIEVRRDPENATSWAVVHKVPSLFTALLTGLIIVAVAMVPLIIALVLRRRVVSVWTIGEIREAAVLEHQETSLAPAAYALRCAWVQNDVTQKAGETDRAVFRLFVPKRALARIEKQGRMVRVLSAGPDGKRIALDWFLS